MQLSAVVLLFGYCNVEPKLGLLGTRDHLSINNFGVHLVMLN